jgi:hypothetical protein
MDWEYEPEPPEERPRDPKVDEAKSVLVQFFAGRPEGVFYERQLKVMFEPVFHWITSSALRELVEEKRIGSTVQPLHDAVSSEAKSVPIRFFWKRGNRYWVRRAKKMKTLIRRFSTPTMASALGRQGELMFDAALATRGLTVASKNVKEWQGRKWTETGENLDRVYQRGRVFYGAEIKNTLPYIPHDELASKLKLCAELRLTPLFIMRGSPKSYNWEVIKAGGYAMPFGTQLYPFGMEDFAEEVRRELELPVGCLSAVPDGLLTRFETWHREKGEPSWKW